MRRLLLPSLTALAILLAPAAADARKPADRNRNAIPDAWERAHRVTVKKDTAKRDADRDGLSTRAEWRSRTDPRKADSDGDGRRDALEDGDRDGLANGFELLARTDPGHRDSDRDRRADGREDADRDGLKHAAEARFGFLPRTADSDGDGTRDGDERAGVITAVAGRVITVAFAAGGTLTAALDPDADVTCDADPDAWNEPDDEGPGDEDAEPGDDDAEEDEGDDEAEDAEDAELAQGAQLELELEEPEADEAFEDECVTGLRAGDLVHSLELEGPAIVGLELLARTTG